MQYNTHYSLYDHTVPVGSRRHYRDIDKEKQEARDANKQCGIFERETTMHSIKDTVNRGRKLQGKKLIR